MASGGAVDNEGSFISGRGSQPKVLIITNHAFDHCSQLEGYKKDHEDLKVMWRSFGCEVSEKRNATGQDIKQEVEEFRDGVVGTEKYVAVFILSHGDLDDLICGIGDNFSKQQRDIVHSSDILACFEDRHGHLREIPKMFFFQMCRGSRHDVRHAGGDDAERSTACTQKLSAMSNALVAFPSQPGLVSFVNTLNGSWFIQDIIETFKQMSRTTHVLDMLTEVNYKMSARTAIPTNAKCMSVFSTTLAKKVRISAASRVHVRSRPPSGIRVDTMTERSSDFNVSSSLLLVDASRIKMRPRNFRKGITASKNLYRNRKAPPKALVICNSIGKAGTYFDHAEDRNAITSLWKSLGCKVVVKENLKSDNMLEEVRRFACNRKNETCLSGNERFSVVFIISFSYDKNTVCGADAKKVTVSSLLEHFKNRNEDLQEMPKLFFLQTIPCPRTAADSFDPPSPWEKSLPEVSDMLIVSAHRHEEDKISVFVAALVKVFSRRSSNEHLTDALISVNEEAGEMACEFTCTLRKKFSLVQ